jgi:alcohol dehydrogenase (NADP+)
MQAVTRFNFKVLNQVTLAHPTTGRQLPGLTLSRTGDTMPSIGLGIWLAKAGQVKNAVTHVLRDLEYLHIDAAMIYFNEEEVGQGMLDGFAATKLTRKDVWLTSKLWNDCHHPDHVIDACKDSISKLKTDYLDLYLIHFPASFQKGIMDAERSDQMTNEPIEDT